MILPYFCFCMNGITDFMHINAPRTFTAISWSHSSTVISRKGLGFKVPKIAALFTKISTRPYSLTVSRTVFSTESSLDTSVVMFIAFPPLLIISFSNFSPLSISAMTMFAPSLAISRAYSAPIPWAAPVIIATLSFSLAMFFPLNKFYLENMLI